MNNELKIMDNPSTDRVILSKDTIPNTFFVSNICPITFERDENNYRDCDEIYHGFEDVYCLTFVSEISDGRVYIKIPILGEGDVEELVDTFENRIEPTLSKPNSSLKMMFNEMEILDSVDEKHQFASNTFQLRTSLADLKVSETRPLFYQTTAYQFFGDEAAKVNIILTKADYLLLRLFVDSFMSNREWRNDLFLDQKYASSVFKYINIESVEYDYTVIDPDADYFISHYIAHCGPSTFKFIHYTDYYRSDKPMRNKGDYNYHIKTNGNNLKITDIVYDQFDDVYYAFYPVDSYKGEKGSKLLILKFESDKVKQIPMFDNQLIYDKPKEIANE